MVSGAVGRHLQLAARQTRPVTTRSENHAELLAELARRRSAELSPLPRSITVALRPGPLTPLV